MKFSSSGKGIIFQAFAEQILLENVLNIYATAIDNWNFTLQLRKAP
jgi:hypothetical protein